MKTLRTIIATALLFVTFNAVAADPTLPELFKRAKEKFSSGDYKGSLADFELLDTYSARAGFESDRAKLISVVTFYRGANLAALGRKAEARDAFVAYLGYLPNAAIASPPYPKATVDIFEQARKEAASRSTTMSGAYAAFIPPAGWKLAADEHWIESPVRYLLTAAQKKEYSTFTSNAERSAFVEAFWKQLDPTPATEVNEFRNEFERRVAFADATFGTDKAAGRYTDRAAVFAFLGVPTYAATSNVATSEDTMASLRANGNDPLNRAAHSSNSTNTAGFSSITGASAEDNLEQPANRGARESWIYRKERIPKGVPFQEVRFNFVTKQGYGTGVLQKDPEPMETLGLATEAARRDKMIN
jgi:GWxTD domain-containing protein